MGNIIKHDHVDIVDGRTRLILNTPLNFARMEGPAIWRVRVPVALESESVFAARSRGEQHHRKGARREHIFDSFDFVRLILIQIVNCS